MVHTEELERKAEILRSISHPDRLKIVLFLFRNEEQNVTSIQNFLGLPQASVSQHLAKLKAEKIIIATRKSCRVYYAIGKNEIRNLIQYIDSLSF